MTSTINIGTEKTADLTAYSQLIGISEFELEKLYPTKVEGMIPSLEELEDK